jgi:hypothetical protein
MSVDEKVLDFFRKKAEQIVEREYNDEICKIKTSISKRKNQLIDEEKEKLQKEWDYENNSIREEFKLLLEQSFNRHTNEYQKALRLIDSETKSGFILKEDSVLISHINKKNYLIKSEYERACRDIIRNQQNQLRAWKQQKRKERAQFVYKNKLSQEQLKKNLTQENQETFERVFREIEVKRQDILKKKMDSITIQFIKKQKTDMELFHLNWNRNKEDKIYAIIEDTIRRDKERIIGSTGRNLSTEVFDIHTVFQERVNNEWNVHRTKLLNSKLLYIQSMTEANTYKINKKYEVIIENKIKECNENLRIDLKNIESKHTKHYNSIITNYKNGIIKELESQEVKIETFSSQSDYEKLKRDANRGHRNLIRNKQKQLRNITSTTTDLLPEYIKSQLKTFDIQITNEKNRTKNQCEKQIVEIKQFYEECRIKESAEDRAKIEAIEKKKVIAEVDSLEQEWKSSKKEASLLLNKVKYNEHLETKLLQQNQLLLQKEEKISNLKQDIYIKKIKINELTEKVQTQTQELDNLKEEKKFLKKFKEKYLEVQASKKKKKKPTRGVWGRHTIIDEPKTIEDFQEIEKKLLMKSVLKEKGPIFAHVYKCNGIYRDESDLEIIFKANRQDIIHIKYEYKFNTFSIKCFDSKISLPFAFEVNKFFCIKLKIVNKLLSVEIDDGNLGSYDIPDDGLLNQIIIRLISNKSIFYHHFIRGME